MPSFTASSVPSQPSRVESLAKLEKSATADAVAALTATDHALPPRWVGRAFSSTHLKRFGLTK